MNISKIDINEIKEIAEIAGEGYTIVLESGKNVIEYKTKRNINNKQLLNNWFIVE